MHSHRNPKTIIKNKKISIPDVTRPSNTKDLYRGEIPDKNENENNEPRKPCNFFFFCFFLLVSL